MRARSIHLLILGLACFLLFVIGNGRVALTNPDEVFYVQTAKEMSMRGEWLTPYLFDQPQFEKPILLYWLLRIAGNFSGFDSFSMRLFPALLASLGVGAVYLLGIFGFKDNRKALLSSLILASSLLYVGLARTVFTDMLFCVLILLSLVAFYWGYSSASHRPASILLFFTCAGFAVLAKGPLGIMLPVLIVVLFLLVRGDLKSYRFMSVLWGLLIFALIALPWYLLMADKYGSVFTHEFFYNDHWRRLVEAEHGSNDRWYFYPACIIGGMFPWSLLVVLGVVHSSRVIWRDRTPFQIFLGLYLVIIFLVFQVAHSKLASYVFPVFPAVALITGDYLVELWTMGNARRGVIIAAVITCLLCIVVIPALLVLGQKEFGVYSACGSVERIFLVVAFLVSMLAGVLHLYFFTRGSVLKGSYTLIFMILAILLMLGVVSRHIEPYLSSAQICEQFAAQNTGHDMVLCSKFHVRAVRHFTGRHVAVIGIKGGDFFSPHPIPFLNTEEQVKNFLQKQGVTYCIITHSDATILKRLAGTTFRYTSLATLGTSQLIRMELSHADGKAPAIVN